MLKEEILKELEQFKSENRFRTIKTNDKNLFNFSSNDYLGLANNKELLKKFYSNKEADYTKYKLSSSSSRLIDGSYQTVMNLEKRVEEIYKKSCLVFNSGFDANSSLIETFFDKKSLIITDRLNHASIYQGCVNSGAKILRYNHLDNFALEKLLEKYTKEYEDILVVTETIYSMDGDCANIKEIVKLKEKYKFLLMVDEAHSYGVKGYGIVYNEKLVNEVDFLVIPLGKAGASMGAYIICDEIYKKYMINKNRKFIYSTALPPVNHSWNLFILNKMLDFSDRIQKLDELVGYSLKKMKELKIKTVSDTHIISVIIGDNLKTINLSEKLKEKGYLAYSIKEPTVPKNTARLRISLTADMEKEDLDKFFVILADEMMKIGVINE